MFAFLKKLFGSKPAEVKPTPYKVETPKVETQVAAKPKAEKKPAVKAKTARKPKAPKAPKA
jgi:hypothetical protein